MDDKMQYIVSARKYRPATFASVVGQTTLTSTLKNAIESGRLAQAYLFCGPRGVGKTSCARIFAKTINCESPTADGEACGECGSCRAMERGNSFNIIELDAASNNSVDDIRALTEQVNVPPSTGRYRVFIIDEVHMLSPQAFNAFLKTLEEPPGYVVFILATTEKHKVIPTILSRCQIYDFKRITVGDIAAHLGRVAQAEGIEAEDSALSVIARKADGAMRDALSIFDQVTACSRGHITYKSAIESLNVLDYDYYFQLVDAFVSRDVQRALLIYKEIRDKGFDSLFFVNGLAGHLRDLMVAYTPQTAQLLEAGTDLARQYTEQSRRLPVEWYYTALGLLNDCDLNYRTVTDKRLHVELALIRLCRIGMAASPVQTTVPPAPSPQGASPAAPVQPKGGTAPQQPVQMPPAQGAQPQQQPQQRLQTRPTVAATPRVGSATAAGRRTVRLTGQPPQTSPSAQQHSPAPVSSPAANAVADQAADPPPRPASAASPGGDIALYWKEYMDSHPQNQLAVSAMRAGVPARQADGRWLFTVSHSGLYNAMLNVLPDLTAFLRTRTGDAGMVLHVEVSAAPEKVKVLSPREALTKAVRENNVLRNLLESIDAEIV